MSDLLRWLRACLAWVVGIFVERAYVSVLNYEWKWSRDGHYWDDA